MRWGHRILPGLGNENNFFFFFKWSFSRALVSWFLACGQSPLWVWFVGKCPISEPCSTPTLCETCSSQGWDQWFFLFPFWKFWHFSTWKSADPREREGSQNHIVWNLSAFKFSHESPLLSVLCGAALVEAVRAWSSKHTKKKPKKQQLCESSAKEQVLQNSAAANFALMEISISQGKNEGSKMSVQAGTRQQMPETCPAAQSGVSLPRRQCGVPKEWNLELFPQGTEMTGESNGTRPQRSGAEWAAACVISTSSSGCFCTSWLEKVGFSSLDLIRQTWGAPYFLLNSR